MRFFIGILMALLATASVANGASNARPHKGEVVGRIIIPAIHVNLPVVEQSQVEDGYFPTHYASTDLPGEGETVAISAHHQTHSLPGADGGPFLRLSSLQPGSVIYIKKSTKFGGGTFRYRVTGQRTISCGTDWKYCTKALSGFRQMQRNKLILTTCDQMGKFRRFVYAFPARR